MLIDINEVKVTDRIRKDFGDIQELADDIKQNGLINPPVVTPSDYELIAGERRLKALKLLGYKQIEVRPMSVKDAEHQLNLEISENETRKDFSKKERIDYARRLERIESVKAEQVKLANLNNQSLECENFPTRETGRTSDIVASKLGIGSGKQYEKEKYISDNADPALLSQWDKGGISTHAAYVQIKKERDELEKKVKQLESKPPIEIDNTDYAALERKEAELKQLNNKYNNLKERETILNERIDIIEKNSEKYKKLTDEIDKLTKDKSDIARRITAVTSISGLTEKIDFMLKNELAPIKYSQALLEASNDEIVAKNLSNIIYSVQRWCDEMKTYLPNDDKNNVIDTEEM
jgi:ParB family chromosome partitioning protein